MKIEEKLTPYRAGFTIVELLVVIVVIAILAAISVVAYNGIQARAYDSHMKNAVNQVEKALKLYAVDYGVSIPGGWGSTPVTAGNQCTNGADGFFGSGSYDCTVEDTLVARQLLPQGFTSSLPANAHFSPGSGGRSSIMLYSCGTGRYGLYWTLRSPTAADTASLDNAFSTCGHATQLRDSWGMRAGRVVQL